MQIYAWKTLVKSYLPIRDANLRLGIEDLMAMLKNMLHFGEISKDIVSRYDGYLGIVIASVALRTV